MLGSWRAVAVTHTDNEYEGPMTIVLERSWWSCVPRTRRIREHWTLEQIQGKRK